MRFFVHEYSSYVFDSKNHFLIVFHKCHKCISWYPNESKCVLSKCRPHENFCHKFHRRESDVRLDLHVDEQCASGAIRQCCIESHICHKREVFLQYVFVRVELGLFDEKMMNHNICIHAVTKNIREIKPSKTKQTKKLAVLTAFSWYCFICCRNIS